MASKPESEESDPVSFLQNLRWTMEHGEIDAEQDINIGSLDRTEICEELIKTAFAAVEFRRRYILKNVLKCLSKNINNIENTKGKSVLDKLLCCAVETGQQSMVEVLLNVGANPSTEFCGKPLLHVAAMCGHLEVVEVLLRRWVPVDTLDKRGDGVLYNVLTSDLQNKECVLRWFIDRGANSKIPSSNGKHLVHVAAANSPKVLELLLEMGQDVNMTDLVNEDTPLHIACNMSNPDSILVLIKHGCHFNTLNKKGETPLNKLLRLTKGSQDFHSRTRLELARRLIHIGFKMYKKDTRSFAKGKNLNGRDKAYDKYTEILKGFADVPSLQSIARSEIRNSLLSGLSVKKQVAKLEIPIHLRSYLLFADFRVD